MGLEARLRFPASCQNLLRAFLRRRCRLIMQSRNLLLALFGLRLKIRPVMGRNVVLILLLALEIEILLHSRIDLLIQIGDCCGVIVAMP